MKKKWGILAVSLAISMVSLAPSVSAMSSPTEWSTQQESTVLNQFEQLNSANSSKLTLSSQRVDVENSPFLMYPDDPYSWGRHLLGTKTWYSPSLKKISSSAINASDKVLMLTTYGYATVFTDMGSQGCAVPYYWSDVMRGDTLNVTNLGGGQAIQPARNDFGPNQKVAGSHIVDLGSYWNNAINGNGLTYVKTDCVIRGGLHY